MPCKECILDGQPNCYCEMASFRKIYYHDEEMGREEKEIAEARQQVKDGRIYTYDEVFNNPHGRKIDGIFTTHFDNYPGAPKDKHE